MATTHFYLGGGSDGKTFWEWFDTTTDIWEDLRNVCNNGAVAYYSCLLIDIDLSLSRGEEKEKAREGLSFAFDEYCKTHTQNIEAFCEVVKGMLSIFSRSYIGRNSFARMSAEAVQVRHSNALRFLDEWRASKGGEKSLISKKTTKTKKKTNVRSWAISDEQKEAIKNVVYDETVKGKINRIRKTIDFMRENGIPTPPYKDFIEVYPKTICRSEYNRVLGEKRLTNLKEEPLPKHEKYT